MQKIVAMFEGDRINTTEDRSVCHTALRMESDERLIVNGYDLVHDVSIELERIQEFTDAMRSGGIVGHTCKKFKNIVAVGIGGSILGPEFVYEALRFDEDCKKASEGMTLKFLGNVDPVSFHRATDGLDLEETMFIIISKTFRTGETMLNA